MVTTPPRHRPHQPEPFGPGLSVRGLLPAMRPPCTARRSSSARQASQGTSSRPRPSNGSASSCCTLPGAATRSHATFNALRDKKRCRAPGDISETYPKRPSRTRQPSQLPARGRVRMSVDLPARAGLGPGAVTPTAALSIATGATAPRAGAELWLLQLPPT